MATATHGIKLTWTPPTGSDPAASYNVYRAPAAAGPFVLLGNSQTTSYTDSTGTPGTQYFYEVTAVDANGNESAMSSVASATELNVPNAPTGLTATAF